ncbi:unnamed protein product [Prunus armeniaca]
MSSREVFESCPPWGVFTSLENLTIYRPRRSKNLIIQLRALITLTSPNTQLHLKTISLVFRLSVVAHTSLVFYTPSPSEDIHIENVQVHDSGSIPQLICKMNLGGLSLFHDL